MQTQRDLVLQLLNKSEWVCGIEFQQNYIPEYRTRINELRRTGLIVQARRCTKHSHRGVMQEWSLRIKGSETQNSAPGQEKQVPPAPIYNSPAYEPKKKSLPYVYRPPQTCCDVAIYCQDKRLPVSHTAGCETQKQIYS